MKRLAYLLSVFVLMICFTVQDVQADEKDKSAAEIVQEMQMGWNLGKSLECYEEKDAQVNEVVYYEQLWHNPKTTKEMIRVIKKSGFGAVRIPITYLNHMDEDGVIDEAWLDRIAEIVDYVIEEDMYAIINIHHETGKRNNAPLQAKFSDYEVCAAYAENLWMQIAEYFKDYDEHLLFESYNEMLDMSAENPWYGEQSSWATMNAMNQLFVNTVRVSGGNNTTRYLIVNTYGAQATYHPLYYFQLPKDIIEDHLIVGVHAYQSSKSGVESVMKCLDATILKKGYPCILGEWAINCMDSTSTEKAENMLSECVKRGITCFWWDDGGTFKLLNRKTCQWYNPELVSYMINITTGKSIDAQKASEKEVVVDHTFYYKELDYVEISTKNGGFQTDVPLSSQISVELTCAITGNDYGNLLAAGSGSNKLVIRQEGEKGVYCAYGWYNSVVATPQLFQKLTITQRKEETYVDDKLVRTAKEQTFQSEQKIRIGDVPCRLYRCRIWDERNNLIHDYIPVYNNKMEACLYDRINDTFWYASDVCAAGNIAAK